MCNLSGEWYFSNQIHKYFEHRLLENRRNHRIIEFIEHNKWGDFFLFVIEFIKSIEFQIETIDKPNS